jgi:hypothetical protein
LAILIPLALAGCTAPISAPASQPYITVSAPITVPAGAVVITFPPGAIVVNVQIGPDKVPLVNVSINGKLLTPSTGSGPATRPAEEK